MGALNLLEIVTIDIQCGILVTIKTFAAVD